MDLDTGEGRPAAGLGGGGGGGNLVGRHVRAGDVDNLPRPDEPVERFERLVDRGVGVGHVLVVEVDPVGAEPPQADLDPLPDAGGECAGLVGLFGRAGQELRGDHGLVPP